jgi:hypothetical protein
MGKFNFLSPTFFGLILFCFFLYQNGDSILILPITRESMIQLNVIGKDLDYKMAVSPPRVLII